MGQFWKGNFTQVSDTMLPQKRKGAPQSADESDSSGYSFVQAASDEEIDISSALACKNNGKQRQIDPEDSDDGLREMIQASIAKRNVKGGTQVLKKTKGKGKANMTKGEVGGGSFQSMGACIAK
jgi:ATP-dependent RNA helicase DDX54/DBP10